MWRERDGQTYHLRLALRELRCKDRRHTEHPGELFVYLPPGENGADVVQLHHVGNREPSVEDRRIPAVRDGIHHHGALCACELCDQPRRRRATRQPSARSGDLPGNG